LRGAGAALKRADVKSGPPLFEAGLCGLGRCVGLFVVVLFGAGVLLLLLFDDAGFDSQHTVPLLQELVLCKMLEGLEQSEDMD
jgi:hypothetical protein